MSTTTAQKIFSVGVFFIGGLILALTVNDERASCGITLPYRFSIFVFAVLASCVKIKNFSQLAQKTTVIITALVFLGTHFFCTQVTGSHGVLISIQILASVYAIVALYTILWMTFAMLTLVKNIFTYRRSKKELRSSVASRNESPPNLAYVTIPAIKEWLQKQDYVRIAVGVGLILFFIYINPLLVFLREHGLVH